jgi:outer membrane protein assembly factor BamB
MTMASRHEQVLVLVGLAVCCAGLHGRAELFDARVRWQSSVVARGSVAVDDSTVYAFANGSVVAVNAITGATRWSYTPKESTGVRTASAITIADNRVIVGLSDLLALDRASGERSWTFRPPNGYGAGLYVGDLTREIIFTGSPVGHVYAIDHATGLPKWTSPSLGPAEKTTVYEPRMAGTYLVAGFTVFETPPVGGLAAFDPGSGVLRWRATFPTVEAAQGSAFSGGPVGRDGGWFATRADGTIFRFDAETGAARKVIPPITGTLSSPRDYRAMAVAGAVLIATSLSGTVTAYDAASFAERWRVDANAGSAAFQITADAGAVYVPYVSGRLIAFDVDTGRELWRAGDQKQRIVTAPALAKSGLYVASSTGLLAFER